MQFLMRVQTKNSSVLGDVKYLVMSITHIRQWPKAQYSQEICFLLFLYHVLHIQCLYSSQLYILGATYISYAKTGLQYFVHTETVKNYMLLVQIFNTY